MTLVFGDMSWTCHLRRDWSCSTVTSMIVYFCLCSFLVSSFPAVLHPVTALAPLTTLMKITPALTPRSSGFVKISPQQFQRKHCPMKVGEYVPPKTNDPNPRDLRVIRKNAAAMRSASVMIRVGKFWPEV